MSSIRELRNVTQETGSTQPSNSSGRLNPSVPAKNASNPGNTGTVFSIRQLRGRTVPKPKLSPLTQPDSRRPQAVVNPIIERKMDRQQARQRQNEVEQAAAYMTAVGKAVGAPSQDVSDYQKVLADFKGVDDGQKAAKYKESYEAGATPFAVDNRISSMKDLLYKEGHDYGGSTHADHEVSKIDAEYEQHIRALDLNDPAYRGKVEALTQKRNNDVARAQAAYSAQQEGRQQQLSQLEEQLDYSWYYYINDIQNRADFKKNSKGSEEAAAQLRSRGGQDFGFNKYSAGYDSEDRQKKYAKQIATYYYLYDNVSAESADAYLDYIMPVVRQANGEEMAEVINYPVLRELIAIGSGVEGGFAGLVNWALDKPIEDSTLQYGARKVLKDLSESDSWWERTVATWATSAAQSAGNMAPGLIASAINPNLGMAVFGTSAAGSAYKEYRDAGVDENNALLGGALRGLSEVFTQKLLGGLQIPGFSGIFTGKAADVLGSKVGSALGKAAVTWGVEIVSEVIEENAQNYIEPAINLLIGAADKYEAPGWDEFIDTTMSTVFLTGVMNAPSTVSNAKKIRSDMQFTKEVINPWIDEAISNGEKLGASEQVALAKELKEQIDGGKVIDPQDFGLRLMDAIAQDAAANAGTATNREDLFVAGRAQASTPQEQSAAQQTEQRAELVQENNPEAEVVKSHGTQLYLDAGADLATAQSAGAVLDGILSGEITSENMSGKQADKLLLYKPYAAQLVSDALGVELQKTETKAQARSAAKAAVLAYEQRIKAVATQENNAPGSVPQSVNTSSVRNDIAAQTQETASAAVPDVQEQTSAPRPVAEPAEQEALQMQSEQNSTRGDFYAQLPTEEGASTAPAGAMSYEDFKYRMRTDKEFRNRYTDEGAKGLSQEARNLRAYDLYQARMGQMQSAAGTMSRTRFAEAYREINATKKNPAQDTEVDLAYQDYLEMQQDRTVTESEQDTVPEDYIGLVENEISEAVPQEVREAVDALAKQFGLQISYEDIGSDNGYYIPGTNRVVLDINPARSAVDAAGRSAYLFTVAHEVGHYARENMSEDAWESFEAHAVAAMGGETAVSAKMQEADDDGNSIYNTEDLAREDVACDFLGKILSDKDALKQFCDAIRDKTVSQPAARGILGAIRKVLAKLAGNKAAKRSEASVQQSVAEGLELFAEDIEAGRKAASEIADALAELAKQPRPLMNSKQAEAILAEAKNKNAAAVHYSLKDAKKIGFDRLIKQFFDKTLSRANPIFISNAPTNAEAMFGTKAPFIISSSDMSKSTRESNGSSRSAHALSRNFIEHLPENIEKSVIGYLENRNGVNSFTFVCLDEETNSLVAVGGAINATYEGQTVNRVLSIFHISSPEFFLTKSGKDLVTTDIEKAKNILEKARIQSPALQNILDSGRIITQTNSVSQERSRKNAIDAAVRTPRLPTRQEAEAILAEAKKSNKEAVRKTSGTQSNIDNAAEAMYNNDKGVDENVSDRIGRGISEGSARSLGTGSQDAEARGIGRGHQGLPRRSVSESLSKAFNESGVVAAELYSFDDDRVAFSSALDAAREADAKNGWCVTPQSAEELSGKLTFMDDGNTIGFVLTDSGDIEGVFKNKAKNKTHFAMNGVIPQAIAAGGTKLDCYGEGLVANYERYGFIPVARVAFNEEYANPGWDASKGKPDIFFMMHNGDSAETVVSKIGTYPHMSEEQLNSLPRYGKDGYDEAMAYRDGLLAERNNASVTSDTDIRRSRKDRQNETAMTAPGAAQRNEMLNENIETIGQLERSTERAIERKTSPQKAQETLEKTDAEIADATKQMPRKSIGLVSKAELEAIDRQHEEARSASAQREAETVFFRRVAGTARTQAINDEVRLIRHAERAERRAERIAARYNERIDALKQQVEHNKRQASLERTFREDAEKSNRALGKGVEALSNDLKNAEQAAQKSSERATAKHEKLRRDAEHNKRQASLESTFRRQTEKENRELNRQAERLRKERDRAIRALQMDTLLRAKGNQQALEAIRGWRHNGHIGRAALAPNEVDTRILTKKEQATLQREPAEGFKAKANALQNRMKGVSQKLAFYFTSERLPFEEMARLQDRVDSIDTAVLAMDNSKSMTNAILTDSLRASDGSVIDGRSVMEVLGCWVDDKVGGKIDEDKQRLFDRYLYMMHSVDRMSAVKNARDAMLAFLNRHPEFKQYVLEYFNAKGEAKSKSLTIRSTEVIRMAAEGNQAAQEFITLAQAFAVAKDKPVFGTADGSKALGAETSKIIADEIAEANPWVKEKAEEFYAYWDKFMQEWYVGKTGTQEQYDAMKKLYPHYVPTYRAFTNQTSSWSYSPNGIGTKNAVSAAKGSTADLNTVGDNVARQVERLVSVARQAELFSNVYQEVLNGTEGFDEYAAIDPQMASLDSQETELALFDPYSEDAAPAQHEENAGSLTKNGNVYTWKSYFNGEQRQMLVSDRVYESLLSMTNANKTLNKMAAAGNTVTSPMKTAITGVNVNFAVRNILRDFYTAIVNSVVGSVKFMGYYSKAIEKMVGDTKLAAAIASKIMKLTDTSLSETERESIGKEFVKCMESARLKGSKEWNDFVALGGTGATRARSETGFLWNKSAKGKIREAKNKTLSVLGAINEFTESIPRFAEYLATIGKYGDTAEGRARGIKNAAEVTVDFSRHGKAGKVLNAYIPYWNPQIQGMAKMYRSIRFPGEGNKMKGSAAWKQRGLVLSRAFVTSVVPRLLQIGILALAGDDDWEEWDELTDRMKDTYFLIPMGDGKFFKLPYGRDWGQIFGSSFSRIAQGIRGREDNWDNFFDTAIMANFNPLSLPIGVQEVVDILRNEDFAGRAIVPYNMTEVESTEAYDEETSRLSVMLAKVFPFKNLEVSPVQIDYLISSYFGDYGDMLIEATDADGLNGLKGFLGEVLAGSFVADSAYSSSTMSKYYELLDDLDSSVKTAKFKDPESYKENWKYDLQRALAAGFGDEISDLNKQERETEDENEKRVLKYQIQELAKQALDFAEKVKSGEITDPVNYVKYDPYGATVRDTIIRMNAEGGKFGSLKDFSYLPSESIPDIEGHDTTDEEKARYKEIYQENYTEFAVGIIETEKFKKATLEEQAAMLEGARELAGFYAKKEWATEFGLKSFNKFGSVTYDPKTASSTANIMFEGGIPADKVGSILRGISDIEPLTGADSVSAYQKYDYILGQIDLDQAQRDAALVSYMSAKEKERYDACAATGVSATTYITVLSNIHNLTPLAGRDGVTAVQKWEVCIKAVGAEKQQDALLDRYMDSNQAAKYDMARSAGVSPKLYVKYYNAKYTYGDKNGSWKQSELQSWLDANVSSTSQKAVLWEIANSGWKNNPYR